MKVINKLFFGFSSLLLLAVVSVNAERPSVRYSGSKENIAKANETDSTKEPAINDKSVVDEVIWVVGDEPILKSDVEMTRLQAEADGTKFPGDPDCSIPEQIAVQKLFLHQAALDSITVSEADVSQGIDDQINYWIQLIGSREKLEEYRKMSVSQIRQQMHDDFKNQQLIRKEREQLVKDIKVSPAQVRDYFKKLPEDSIPFIPTQVEVEIIAHQPKIEQAEIDRIKDELRDFTKRVTNGETTFATLARLYSEDPGTARQGGELGYTGRGMLDPAFANVAFNLTDPKKISKIVESEFGYHIIQLIDKRGDKINVRHILLKPKVSDAAVKTATLRVDSIYNDIHQKKFTFEQAASYLSDDKDTRNNDGLMSNASETGRTSRFEMKDLPTEIARVVDTLKVNEISVPFTMINSKGKEQVVIVKLKSRIPGHRAAISEDFQVMQNIVLAKEKEKTIHDWVVNKIKHTYVKMTDRYKKCKFEYQGWVK
jgi:peptidyl-prolyl cis-trans isomerase SurA